MRFSIKVIAIASVVAAAMAAQPAVAAVGDGSPADSNIRYVGRWDTRSSSTYVPGWAGAYAVVGFTGTTVKLRQRNSVDLYASIDGGAWVSYRGVKGTVNLTPARLTSGTHTLRVSYRQVSGSYCGDLVFQGVILYPERQHLRDGDVQEVVRQRDESGGRRAQQRR